MQKRQFDVWLKSVKPDDHIESVLSASLKSRIKAVRHYLTLAAESSSTEMDPVHQLRVWTRRSVAVLQLYKPLLPRKQSRTLRKLLNSIRESAGPARDLDVLIDRYRSDADQQKLNWMLQRLSEKRDQSQAEIIAVNEELKRGKRLKKHLNSIVAVVPTHTDRKARRIAFSEWGKRPLSKLVQQFADAMPYETSDITAVHQFRIRGKQLRYGIELLAPAFHKRLKNDAYPELKQIQNRLGKVNDHFVAVNLLGQWVLVENDPNHCDELKARIAREKEAQDQALNDFQQWWSIKRMQRVLRPVQEILSDG